MACNEVHILPCREGEANKILSIFPSNSSCSFITMENTKGVLFLKKEVAIILILQTSSFFCFISF